MSLHSRRAILSVLVLGQLLLLSGVLRGQTSSVYVTEHGTHFHTHRDCIALKRAKPEHVHAIDREHAVAYTLCPICKARKVQK